MTRITVDEDSILKKIEAKQREALLDIGAEMIQDIIDNPKMPQKDTFSASGNYRRTGDFRDGWNVVNKSGNLFIVNTTGYSNYVELGTRKMTGLFLVRDALRSVSSELNFSYVLQGSNV